MGVGMRIAVLALVVEPDMLVVGVVAGVVLVDGVVDLHSSFFADLGVVVLGVVTGLGVELFSLPAFLPE